MRVKLVEIKSLKISCPDNRLEREQAQMKKDLAEVKASAEAMVDSNCVRDAYIDKEQDKFFHQVN